MSPATDGTAPTASISTSTSQPSTVTKCVSVPRRIGAVLKTKGGHTKYLFNTFFSAYCTGIISESILALVLVLKTLHSNVYKKNANYHGICHAYTVVHSCSGEWFWFNRRGGGVERGNIKEGLLSLGGSV